MSRAWPVPDIEADASVMTNARRILAVRIAEYYSYLPAVAHPELAAELHALRIAAKRLRYTLELFRPQFGAKTDALIADVKAIQEALGLLHDHDVRIELAGDELSALMLEQSRVMRQAIADASPAELSAIAAAALRPPPDDPRRGLIGLLGREHAARRAAYARFREAWDRVEAGGLRAGLVVLSAMAIPEAPERGETAA